MKLSEKQIKQIEELTGLKYYYGYCNSYVFISEKDSKGYNKKLYIEFAVVEGIDYINENIEEFDFKSLTIPFKWFKPLLKILGAK